MIKFRPLIVVLFFLVTGCAASNVLVDKEYSMQSGDQFRLELNSEVEIPEAERGMLEQTLRDGLAGNNLLSNEANTILQVTVTKYHFRSEATRVLTGNTTGSDAIISTVVIKRVGGGEPLGQQRVYTQNPTVVSTSKDLIEAHAQKIINSLKK